MKFTRAAMRMFGSKPLAIMGRIWHSMRMVVCVCVCILRDVCSVWYQDGLPAHLSHSQYSVSRR